MEIIYKKLSELKPYKNNPRFNDNAVDKVAQSIKEFGFKVPIVIDKNNVVVTGHTRLKAAEQLGLKEAPVIIADDLSEKQIKAFRLADNKVSDYSIWDNKKLLEELDDLGFDIFSGFEISDLFEDVLDEKDNEVLDENKNGVVYVLKFKTENKELIDDIADFIRGRALLDE